MDDAKFRQIAYEIARFHYEKYNGRGYPDAMMLEDSFSIIEKRNWHRF